MARSFRPVTALVGVLVAAVLGTTGCTTTLEGAPAADSAPPTEGPGSDPVAWADSVCDAVLSFAMPAVSAPDFTATSDLSGVQRAFIDYLNAVVAGLQGGRAQLAAVGRAPDPAGDEAVGRTDAAMQVLERELGGAKTAVETADVNNPAAFMTTLTQVEATLAGINPPNPVGELASAPRLQRAAERAARCRQLSTLTPPAPR
jgi:hypothetical protein